MDTSNSLVAETRKVGHSTIATLDRKRILIFIAIAYGIVIMLVLVYVLTGGNVRDFNPGPIVWLVMAFVPAIANVATRLITREGWSHTYLRPNLRRGWLYYLAALTLPLTAIILGGAIYFLLFPGRFDLSMAFARQAGKIPAADTWVTVIGSRFFEGFKSLLFGTWLIVFGEEFGWRAYLLPKLMPIGSRKAVLLTGVIWSAWHWPIISLGFNYGTDYWGAPVSALLLFTIIILGPSILYSWMALRTGSVWPACVAHAENNLFCYLMVLFLIGKPDVLIGPSNEGIIGCLGYVLLALPIFLIPGALTLTASSRTTKPEVVQTAQQMAG